MELIISTDGTARRTYMSDDEVECAKVDDIRHSSTVYGPPTYRKRDTAHVTLSSPDALYLATEILLGLVEDGTLAGWNISFPERPDLVLDDGTKVYIKTAANS